MKFGRFAATTDADVLVYFVSICVFFAPALYWWALTDVESMLKFLKSGSM
ncbi:hypothetical protein ABER23_04950 [Paenibacillus lautus]